MRLKISGYFIAFIYLDECLYLMMLLKLTNLKKSRTVRHVRKSLRSTKMSDSNPWNREDHGSSILFHLSPEKKACFLM